MGRKSKNGPTFIVSARIPRALAHRLEWLVRNHEEVEDRTQAVHEAIVRYVEAREAECRKLGLFPPAAA